MRQKLYLFLAAFSLLIVTFLTACGLVKTASLPEGVDVLSFDAQALSDALCAAARANDTQLILFYLPSEALEAQIQAEVDRTLSSRYDCAYNVDTVTWSVVNYDNYVYIKFSLLYEANLPPRPPVRSFSSLHWGEIIMDMLTNKETDYTVCIPRADVEDAALKDALSHAPEAADSALFTYLAANSSWYVSEYEDYWVVGLELVYRQDACALEAIYHVESPYEAACYLIDAMLTGDETVTMYVKDMEKERLQLLWDTARINDGADMVEESLTGKATYWDNADGSYICEIRSQYSGTAATREAYRLELMAVLKELEQTIRDAAPQTEEDTYRLIAQVVAERTAYDDAVSKASVEQALTPDMCYTRTAYGALVQKDSVCTGYAAAFKALCDRFGLPCWVMLGSFDDVGHAWNIVLLDGEVRYVDVTFFDTARSDKHLLFTQQEYEKRHYVPEEGYVTPDWYGAA